MQAFMQPLEYLSCHMPRIAASLVCKRPWLGGQVTHKVFLCRNRKSIVMWSELTSMSSIFAPRDEVGILAGSDEAFSVLGETMHKAAAVGVEVVRPPRFIVVGAQSSGKSTLLNALIGADQVLPVGSDMTTKVPLEVHFQCAPGASEVTISVSHRDGDTYVVDAEESVPVKPDVIVGSIERLSSQLAGPEAGVGDAGRSIHMHVVGPACPFLELVDLPGLVTVHRADKGQPEDTPRRIENLIAQYAGDAESTYLLLVMPARVDMETDIAWSVAKRFDPHGDRTAVILTKPDLAEGHALDRYLSDSGPSSLRAGLGYHVCCLQHGTAGEQAYFAGAVARFRGHEARLGVTRVIATMSDHLKHNVRSRRAGMLAAIAEQHATIHDDWIRQRGVLQLAESATSGGVDAMLTEIVMGAHEDLFRRGGQVGQCLFSAMRHTGVQLVPRWTPDLEAELDGALRAGHGLHLPIGSILGDVLQAFLKADSGRLVCLVDLAANGCFEELRDILCGRVAHHLERRCAPLRCLRRLVQAACDDVVAECGKNFLQLANQLARIEFDYVWLTESFLGLYDLTDAIDDTPQGAKALVTKYLTVVGHVLEHNLSKAAISTILMPFAQRLRSRITELMADDSQALESLLQPDGEDIAAARLAQQRHENIQRLKTALESF